MQLTDIFIRRPVFSMVVSLIILLVGLRSYQALPVRQYPVIEASVVTVTTTYSGASAKLMEGFVSTPLENALAGVEGVDFMTSANTQGSSVITLQFHLGYNVNKGITDISNAVSSVRAKLPQDINDPVIAKNDPNAQPTVYISFASNRMSAGAVSDYLARVVQPQLSTLPGVAQANILGERAYAMRIWLDPQRMASLGVVPEDVQNALMRNNVQSAPGTIEGHWQEYNVSANTDLNTVEQFNNLVVKSAENYLVRIKDIGHAELGAKSYDVSVIVNNVNTVVIGVIPQSTANPLEVSKQVNKVLPNIKRYLPPSLNVMIIWDSSKFISESLKEVSRTILEASACVVLVIFLFLGSLRAVLIPVVTIPLSVIGVCALMLYLGYTINTLTLLAWVLAIGLVVDDAIVVLENIHRHIEEGLTPVQAAITGAREIGFAVIAMTLTLAAVYAPIGFLSGLTGNLFREFAFTLAGAVIVSGFVALTLSPMMCAKILHHDPTRKGLPEKIDNLFRELMTRYRYYLSQVLARKRLVIGCALAVYFSCFLLYTTLPSELAPEEDQGAILGIVSGPTSATLAYTEKYTRMLQSIYEHVPEMEGYGLINGFPNGVSSAISFLILKPWGERKRTTQEIIKTLFPQFWAIPGVMAFPVNLPALPGTSGRTPVSFVLKTTGTYEQLQSAMQKLLMATRQNPHFLNVDTDLKMDKIQIDVDVDRNLSADLGIPMSGIASALNLLLGEPTVTRFSLAGRSYEVIPELMGDFRDNPHQLNNINVRTFNGGLVPLSNIIHLSNTIAPQNLLHFQQLRAATLTASLTPGYSLGEALKYLETNANKILPKYIQQDYSGQSRQFVQASGAMMQTFLFALIFIFLVLAAQFESFRDPLIVMISVPLSLSGALCAIHLSGGTLNIYTQIGLVTLIGLISKHGILIVEFANQLQDKGYTLRDAVIESASLRLRPILMTTAAMILGALPLAMASGAGAEARSQLGWVIMGGMGFGTLLTLFVVPMAYLLLAEERKKTDTLAIESQTSPGTLPAPPHQ